MIHKTKKLISILTIALLLWQVAKAHECISAGVHERISLNSHFSQTSNVLRPTSHAARVLASIVTQASHVPRPTSYVTRVFTTYGLRPLAARERSHEEILALSGRRSESEVDQVHASYVQGLLVEPDRYIGFMVRQALSGSEKARDYRDAYYLQFGAIKNMALPGDNFDPKTYVERLMARDNERFERERKEIRIRGWLLANKQSKGPPLLTFEQARALTARDEGVWDAVGKGEPAALDALRALTLNPSVSKYQAIEVAAAHATSTTPRRIRQRCREILLEDMPHIHEGLEGARQYYPRDYQWRRQNPSIDIIIKLASERAYGTRINEAARGALFTIASVDPASEKRYGRAIRVEAINTIAKLCHQTRSPVLIRRFFELHILYLNQAYNLSLQADILNGETYDEILMSLMMNGSIPREASLLRVYASGFLLGSRVDPAIYRLSNEVLTGARDLKIHADLLPIDSAWSSELYKGYCLAVSYVMYEGLLQYPRIKRSIKLKEVREDIVARGELSHAPLSGEDEDSSVIANSAFQCNQARFSETAPGSELFGVIGHEFTHRIASCYLGQSVFSQPANELFAFLGEGAFYDMMGWQAEQKRWLSSYRGAWNRLLGEGVLAVRKTSSHDLVRAFLTEMDRYCDLMRRRVVGFRQPSFVHLLCEELQCGKDHINLPKLFERLQIHAKRVIGAMLSQKDQDILSKGAAVPQTAVLDEALRWLTRETEETHIRYQQI